MIDGRKVIQKIVVHPFRLKYRASGQVFQPDRPSTIFGIIMSQYKYKSSIKYIDELKFDHIETYSFQRGTSYEDSLKKDRSEYEKLRVRKEKRNNLLPEEEARFAGLDSLRQFRNLINEAGQFHPTSEKTHTFNADDEVVTRLREILHTDINNVPAWMCAPLYRDAIVFRDKTGRIVSCLNVCLDCEYMETKMYHHINGDAKTYLLLREFFIYLGHKVEPKY